MDKDLVIKWLDSTILNIEKQKVKFKIGSSQSTLINNRLFALNFSLNLLRSDLVLDIDDIEKVLEPLRSIIRKSLKAQKKHESDKAIYKRLQNNIEACQFCIDKIMINSIKD